jgi:hypothetical protein
MGVEDSGSPEEPPKPADTGDDQRGSDEKGEIEHADADEDGDGDSSQAAATDSTAVDPADADDIGDDEVPTTTDAVEDSGADDPDNAERERELKPNDPRWDGQWNSTSAETEAEQPATAAEADSSGQDPAADRDATSRDEGGLERERELAPRAVAGDSPSSTESRAEQPSQETPAAETEIPGQQGMPAEIPVRQPEEQARIDTPAPRPEPTAERQGDAASRDEAGSPYEGSFDYQTGDLRLGSQDQTTAQATPREHLPGDTTGGAWQERFSPGGDQPNPGTQAEAADKPNRDEVGIADDKVPEEPEEDPLNEAEESEEYVDRVAEGRPEAERSEETKTGQEHAETRTGHEAHIEAVPPVEPTLGAAATLLGVAALAETGFQGIKDTWQSIRGGEPSMMPEEPKTSDEDDRK